MFRRRQRENERKKYYWELMLMLEHNLSHAGWLRFHLTNRVWQIEERKINTKNKRGTSKLDEIYRSGVRIQKSLHSFKLNHWFCSTSQLLPKVRPHCTCFRAVNGTRLLSVLLVDNVYPQFFKNRKRNWPLRRETNSALGLISKS